MRGFLSCVPVGGNFVTRIIFSVVNSVPFRVYSNLRKNLTDHETNGYYFLLGIIFLTVRTCKCGNDFSIFYNLFSMFINRLIFPISNDDLCNFRHYYYRL